MVSFSNKKILVTGSCGTVGSELVRLLLDEKKYQVSEVIGLDNNESELFFQEQKFQHDERTTFVLADIRDEARVKHALREVDIVFHAAALKHVIMCERGPMEAVRTNINGVQNIIDAAIHNEVERVIFTSSDKAVNPTNVMGTSKLMGERLFSAANSTKRTGGPIFSSTRFGNVLGSNGSVLPIFHNQIKKGGPITVTDEGMTRFVMSVTQAVELVINSTRLAKGGEVFITKMPTINIMDLAHVMIDKLAPVYGHKPSDIEIKIIGAKAGEKRYEELMSLEETQRAVELDSYFSVLPAFRSLYADIDYNYENIVSKQVTDPYSSDQQIVLTREEIFEFLTLHGLLETS